MLTEHTDEMRDFIEAVRQTAELDYYEEAEQVSRATLNALGQAISGGQAKQLAGWLPQGLGDELASQSGQASAFDKAQFLDKVAGKIPTVDQERAERQVSAVLSRVRAAATAEQLEDTLAQLPPDLAVLFDGPTR